MKPATCTSLFLLAWAALAVGYDLYVLARWGREATITHVLGEWVEDYPILLIAFGCLLWHLFGKGK